MATLRAFSTEHAISPDVWRDRPYIRWTTDEMGPIRQAFAGLSSARTVVRWAKQSDGWIITRHAPPGLELPHIWPEIRPDSPIQTKPSTKHYHGDPQKAPTPEALNPRHVYSPQLMTNNRHIERTKYEDDHHGVNTDEIHEHAALAKYVFPPTPKVDKHWSHNHEEYRDLERRMDHVARHDHQGIDTGNHPHVSRVKDRSISLAARIDIHPRAIEKFPRASRVFFVIEGCIKSDAVLSAGEAALSVPSVTLWDCSELNAVTASYLSGGRLIVIVPDSDWEDIGAVATQARLLQTRLRRIGIVAVIAAPPQPALGADGKRKKLGVDDYLYADGRLGDLDVIDRLPSPHLEQFAQDTANRRDQARRTFDVLWALSMHASRQGEIRVSLRLLARITGIPVMRISRGVQDLENLGAIAIDGDLSISRGRFIGRGQYIEQLDWEDMPTFTIREDLRPLDQSRYTLDNSRPVKVWQSK